MRIEIGQIWGYEKRVPKRVPSWEVCGEYIVTAKKVITIELGLCIVLFRMVAHLRNLPFLEKQTLAT